MAPGLRRRRRSGVRAPRQSPAVRRRARARRLPRAQTARSPRVLLPARAPRRREPPRKGLRASLRRRARPPSASAEALLARRGVGGAPEALPRKTRLRAHATARGRQQAGAGGEREGGEPLRDPRAPRAAPALGPSPGARRSARLLGDPQ